MGSVSTYRPHYMKRARRWQLSGPPDIGAQTSSALSTWGAGEKYPLAREDAAGNGSLMAVSPVALVAKDSRSAAELGEKFAGFTHPAGVAKFANRQYAAALWMLSRGADPPLVIARCGIPRPFGMATDGGTMGFCLIAAALAFEAVQAVVNGSTPFDALVAALVDNAGDTDTNGCVAGALLGAAYGQAAWASAPDWVLGKLADYDNWIELADQLLAKYAPVAGLGLVA
jgi:ADP-ribosylglycohydrolase